MADDQGQQVSSAAKQAADDLAQMTAKPVPEERLADVAEEFEEKQWDPQAMYNAGGHFKEQVEATAKEYKGPPSSAEAMAGKGEIVEIPTTPEVGPEMAGYMEKVEKEAELSGGVTDNYVQQALMQSGNQQNKTVTLPLNQEQIEQGLHHKVWEGIRWMAEWCVRQIKLFHGKVIWKP